MLIFILRLYWGFYWGYLGVVYGLWKRKWKLLFKVWGLGLGLYRDNGKEHGNYKDNRGRVRGVLCREFIGDIG